MNATEKTIDWVDYVVAHPFFIPLWAALFGWMVQSFAVGWFWLIPISCFGFWFYSYLHSAPRLFAYYSRHTEKREVLPCIQPANT